MSIALDTIGTNDVARLTGLSFRVLDYWVRHGAVGPSVEAHGSGTRRGWTLPEVKMIAVLAGLHGDLRALGMSTPLPLVASLWDELRTCGCALVMVGAVTIELRVPEWDGG